MNKPVAEVTKLASTKGQMLYMEKYDTAVRTWSIQSIEPLDATDNEHKLLLYISNLDKKKFGIASDVYTTMKCTTPMELQAPKKFFSRLCLHISSLGMDKKRAIEGRQNFLQNY